MASIETPPNAEEIVATAAPRSKKAVPEDVEELHFLVSELRDDNSRSRLREGVWISIIIHLVALFAMREIPRYLPKRAVIVASPQETVRQAKSPTFIDLPPDLQKVFKRPETDKISDKDRNAASRNPSLTEPEPWRDNRRAGAPAAAQRPTPQQPAPQPVQQAGAPQPQPARPSQNPVMAQAQPRQPINRESFRVGGSAAAAVEQAARASIQTRGGGIGGEYGSGPANARTDVKSDIDILSDTQGVDFAPYLQRVMQAVRTNWYTLIPEIARPPLLKQGRVAIEFAITNDGKVAGMRLAGPSGDVSLDRAAWGGITASNPFPPLPKEFKGEYLALRFHFYYNPNRGELR